MRLTKRQKEILDFISGFIQNEGYSPSMEEIAAHFRISSVNAVYKHLEALKMRGYLTRDANRARSIELSNIPSSGVRSIPLLGNVAAGRPIEAIANAESVRIPEDFFSSTGPFYVLRVQGDSMVDEHIEDGDYVIVESREEAVNGEKVVALIDGEDVTLKKFYRNGKKITLRPANTRLAPLQLDGGRVRVQGVVVGVIRRY